MGPKNPRVLSFQSINDWISFTGYKEGPIKDNKTACNSSCTEGFQAFSSFFFYLFWGERKSCHGQRLLLSSVNALVFVRKKDILQYEKEGNFHVPVVRRLSFFELSLFWCRTQISLNVSLMFSSPFPSYCTIGYKKDQRQTKKVLQRWISLQMYLYDTRTKDIFLSKKFY